MIGMMLAALASQPVPEITPSIDTFSLATLSTGTCGLNHVSSSASIRLTWSTTSFNYLTQSYKLYRDGILVNTGTTPQYDYTVAGLKENDPHAEQAIYFNYRLDISRNSDNAVLVSSSLSEVKTYGNCDTRLAV